MINQILKIVIIYQSWIFFTFLYTYILYIIYYPPTLQDTLGNPTVTHFMDDNLSDSNFTTKDILNFLYNGPEERRERGMAHFDWRNIFNVVDQVIRTLNRYGEVSTRCLLLWFFPELKHQLSRSVPGTVDDRRPLWNRAAT